MTQPKPEFRCPDCPKTFLYKWTLKRHMLNHSTSKYTCDYCSLHFYRLDLLSLHKLKCEQKVCDICKLALSAVKSFMNNHQDVTLGDLISEEPQAKQRTNTTKENTVQKRKRKTDGSIPPSKAVHVNNSDPNEHGSDLPLSTLPLSSLQTTKDDPKSTNGQHKINRKKRPIDCPP